MKVSATKPYLIRAIYDWCIDNALTVYISAVVDQKSSVPEEYIQDGEITLNISPMAVRDLLLDNDIIQFTARFKGNSKQICIPISTVKAIFAKEINQGLFFTPEIEQKTSYPVECEDTNYPESLSDNSQEHENKRSRTHLKIVR